LFPSVRVYAYMDDITLTSTDPDEAEKAYNFIREQARPLGLFFNEAKCEWFGPVPCPPALKNSGVTEVSGSIKVVGVFIGAADSVRGKLAKKFDKHACFFNRLNDAPCSLQTWLVLRNCGLPRHNFTVRTHDPEVTEDLCHAFDEAILGIVRNWTASPITSSRAIGLLHLPTAGAYRGGLGITSTLDMRSFAYAASRDPALRQFGRIPSTSPPPMTQQAARDASAASLYHELMQDHLAARHIREMRARHTNAWLQPFWMSAAPTSFSAALRFHLLEVTAAAASSPSCTGCRKSFTDPVDNMLHGIGCASRPGINATTRHNALRDYICRILRESSVLFEREPRDFEKHSCRRCAAVITRNQVAEHIRVCNGKLDRHGPDLRIVWPGDDNGDAGEIFYDLTVIHVTAPSYNASGVKAESLISERDDEKQRYYRNANLQDGQTLVVLPVRALGGLPIVTVELLHRVARAADRCPREVIAEFSFVLQTVNGEVSRGTSSRLARGRHVQR